MNPALFLLFYLLAAIGGTMIGWYGRARCNYTIRIHLIEQMKTPAGNDLEKQQVELQFMDQIRKLEDKLKIWNVYTAPNL